MSITSGQACHICQASAFGDKQQLYSFSRTKFYNLPLVRNIAVNNRQFFFILALQNPPS